MKNETAELSKSLQMMFLFVFSAFIVMLPDAVFAGGSSGWQYYGSGTNSNVGDAICYVASAFYGEVAAAIATIAVCTLGTLACVGRVQWTNALMLAVGISVIFGAAFIIHAIVGGTEYCDAPSS